MNGYFITAIDTDIGKTIATGLLAKAIQKDQSVITMKIAQTGCKDLSEDIQTHRQLMGIDLLTEDKSKLTCPYVFNYPASPHFSAELEKTSIDLNVINQSIEKLNQQYDCILLEGVGGLMVPITPKVQLIDYLKTLAAPIILVTSGKLGSINHTLLSLMALQQANLKLHGVIYNNYPDDDHPINLNSKSYIKQHLSQHFPDALWGEMQSISDLNYSTSDTILSLEKKALWFSPTNG